MLKISALSQIVEHGRHFPFYEGPDFFSQNQYAKSPAVSTPLKASQNLSSVSPQSPLSSSLSSSTVAEWKWIDGTGKWHRYDAFTEQLLETAWARREVPEIELNHDLYGRSGPYRVNFSKMQQKNIRTGFNRKIERTEISLSRSTPDTSPSLKEPSFLSVSSSPHFISFSRKISIDESPNFQNTQSSHLWKIIGNEKDGLFILAREQKDLESKSMKTFIDISFPHISSKQAPLFKTGALGIVGASVSQQSEENTLPSWAAYTVAKTTGKTILYESHIVEIAQMESGAFSKYSHASGRHFINHKKKEEGCKEMQRVQFLSSNSRRLTWYLHLREGKDDSAAELYSVSNNNKSEGPLFRSLIADKFVWCEYQPSKEFLYVLSSRSHKDLISSDLHLRCYSFADKADSRYSLQAMLFEKDEKEITVELDVCLQFSIPQAPRTYLNPWFDLSNRKSETFVHVVTLRTGSSCLCVQHPITHSFVEISIYLLQNKTKMSFTIGLSSESKINLDALRVFFGSLGDMLLIYLPGHYVQFIDCAHDISIFPTLSFSGDILAPFAPFSQEQFPVLVPFDFRPRLPSSGEQNKSPPDIRGHCFFDIVSGCAYEYSFNRETIWKIYDMNFSDRDLHIQLLHVAMIHMQDDELVAKIMSHVCSNTPSHASSQFFQEFIVGSAYHQISCVIKSKTEVPLDRFFPLTTLEPVNLFTRIDMLGLSPQTPLKKVKLKNITYSAISSPSPRSTLREERLMLGDPPSNKRLTQLREPTAAKSPPGVKRFIRDLLGLDDVGPKPEENEDVREGFAFREAIREGLSQNVIPLFPKEKNFIHTLSHTYCDYLLNQSTELLKFLTSYSKSIPVTFRLMENFYVALEEYALPFPKGFQQVLTEYGFNCLQRGIFLQYLDQGIFLLDEPLVLKMIRALGASSDDQQFKYHLSCRLPHQFEDTSEYTASTQRRDPCLSVLRQTCDSHQFAQYLVGAFGELAHAVSDEEIYSQLTLSPFIPAHEFFNRVRLKYPSDWELVKNSVKRQLSKTFGFSWDLQEPRSRSFDRSQINSSLNDLYQ